MASIYEETPGFRHVSNGLILTILTLAIGGFDLLPDVLGYVLIWSGLASIGFRNRALRGAWYVAGGLALFECVRLVIMFAAPAWYADILQIMQPRRTELPTNSPFPQFTPFVLRVTPGSISGIIEILLGWLLCAGLADWMFARGDRSGADSAALQRDLYMLFVFATLVVLPLASTPSAHGGSVLIMIALFSFALSISLIVLLRRAARPLPPDHGLDRLLTPLHSALHRRPVGLLDRVVARGRAFSVCCCVLLVGTPLLLWWNATPCTWPDVVIRRTGCVVFLAGQMGQMTGVAFHPHAQTVVTNSWGAVTEYRVTDGKTMRHLGTRRGLSHGVAVSSDGSMIAAAQNSRVGVWRAGELLFLTDVIERDIWNITFSSDGALLATVDGKSTIHLWSVDDGRLLRTLHVRESTGEALQFTADNTGIIALSRTAVTVWRVDDGRLIHHLNLEQNMAAVAIAPDGRTFAVTSGGVVHVRRLSDGAHVRSWRIGSEQDNDWFAEYDSEYFWLAFSPDGSMLATRGSESDEIVNIWRISDGTKLAQLLGPSYSGSYGVGNIAFSGDNRYIAASGFSAGEGWKNVTVWRVPDSR